MSRYEIAKNKFSRIAFRFHPARNVKVLSRYVQQCIDGNADMDASNQPVAALEQASVQIAREMVVPVLVESESQARIMKLAYSYTEVYSFDTIPSDRKFAVILGHVLCPQSVKSIVRLIT